MLRVCPFEIDLMSCVYSITRSGPNICVSPFHIVLPLHCRTTAEAMDKTHRSSAPWANQSSRRDDKRRDHRDDFDEFLEKKRRELMDFKEENDRLRADRNRERAEND